MVSMRFCSICGAANNETPTHCFACGQPLPEVTRAEVATHGELLHERYRPGALLGSGGYSSVSRGWDTQQNEREVAIKQINLRGLTAEETIEATNTYNREIEALSALTHPQVPRLYDHFADPNHWYLVLEYIKGQTLETFLSLREAQSRPLKLAEILALGLQLCTVLEYLHTRQPPLIFRDLKPGNIMRTPDGTLYLIDFGIARRYTRGQSRDTQSLGSPGYAAPEQYGRAQTDARADIYSLGSLLRYMLTGHDPSEVLPALLPSRLNGQPGNAELESLIAHMLASEPQDRPHSAFRVARELEHIRQLSLTTQQTGSIWQPPIPQNYTPATASAALADAQIYLQYATIAQPGLNTGKANSTRRKHLTRRRVLLGLGASAVAATVGIGLGIKYTATGGTGQNVYTYRGHSGPVNSVSWSFDSQYIASASSDKSAQTWGALAGNLLNSYTNTGSVINSIAYTFSNAYAIGCANADVLVIDANGMAIFYAQEDGPVNSVAWSPDGVYLTCADTTVRIWHPSQYTFASPTLPQANNKPGDTFVAWSPDSQSIFSNTDNTNTIECWQISDMHTVFATYSGHTEAVTCIACSPDGLYLAAGSQDASVIIWDTTSATIQTTISLPSGQIRALSWSPDGQYFAFASDDGMVRIWSLKDNRVLFTYMGHTGPVYTVAWSPNGQYLASAGEDTTVQVWQTP